MSIKDIKKQAEEMSESEGIENTRDLARMIVKLCEELHAMKPMKDKYGTECSRCHKFAPLSRLTAQREGLVCVDCLDSELGPCSSWGLRPHPHNQKTKEPLERARDGATADWQPIETAPENVTVMLYCPHRHFANVERIEIGMARSGRYFAHGKPANGTWSHHAWATHWATLPPPPNA